MEAHLSAKLVGIQTLATQLEEAKNVVAKSTLDMDVATTTMLVAWLS